MFKKQVSIAQNYIKYCLPENKICLIGAIEKIRSKNNVNWMNLMRLAFSVAPNEAKK